MSDAAFLRVWQPEGLSGGKAPTELTGQSTLSQFFHQHAWPEICVPRGDSAKTRKEYLKSLDYWIEYTGDPSMVAIDDRTCTRFVRMLQGTIYRGKPLSPNTLAKHCDAIQRLLNWAGRRGPWNRKGADLITHAPYIEHPGRPGKAPGPAFTLEELWYWFEAIEGAALTIQRISQFDPVAWWRAYVLVGYNTGLRPQTLFGMRWEMLYGNLLAAPHTIVKGKNDRQYWVNDFAMAALEPLRRPRGLIFGWEDWPSGRSTFYRHYERTQKGAGIRQLPPYGLRRAFSTQASKINPLAMQIQMGHVGLGLQMAAEHYIDHAELLGDALGKLPQPGPAVQKHLFD